MSSSSPPPRTPDRPSGLRWNAWNLLLLVPLLMLVTPWFNSDQPRLGGLPFFYWFQFLFVIVGVACVWIVYLMTRKPPARAGKPVPPSPADVDNLDEGTKP